eukprot:2978643-Rhodomonas_salina.1
MSVAEQIFEPPAARLLEDSPAASLLESLNWMPDCYVEVGIKERIVGNGLEVALRRRPHIVAEKRLGKWRWGL